MDFLAPDAGIPWLRRSLTSSSSKDSSDSSPSSTFCFDDQEEIRDDTKCENVSKTQKLDKRKFKQRGNAFNSMLKKIGSKQKERSLWALADDKKGFSFVDFERLKKVKGLNWSYSFDPRKV